MVLLYKFAAVLILWNSTGSGNNDESPNAVTRAKVDLIELNHFLDDEGREVFQQVIFYDWCKPKQQFHVRAWRLIKNDSQRPIQHWNPRSFQCTWHDGPVLRQVSASKMRETWSQQDPERVNRALLPEKQRIPLFPPRVAKHPNSLPTSPTPTPQSPVSR
ncbi:MAG: hypothetical protein ACPGPS_07375 [Rubripirellula sp.]|jgi:hypothetical protein